MKVAADDFVVCLWALEPEIHSIHKLSSLIHP